MSTRVRESAPPGAAGEPRKVQLWQIAAVAAGFLLLLAHALLGTRLPLPGGGLVAGLLLPALLFVAPFLRVGKPAGSRETTGAIATEPARAAVSHELESAPSARSARLAVDLRRANRRHAEGRSMRIERLRAAVYVLVPLAAIASLGVVGVFGAVVCFGSGAIALMLLNRDESG